MEIIRQAQARMRETGSLQWQDGYPALAHIEADIACGRGFVACIPARRGEPDASSPAEKGTDRVQTSGSNKLPAKASTEETERSGGIQEPAGSGERILAYAAIVFDGEPAYDALEGAWHGGPDYGAVHRLAVADEALHKGVGTAMLREAMRQTRARGLGSFRIDTARENRPMRRLLTALGFVYRGIVHYASGERMAFEKQLSDETC